MSARHLRLPPWPDLRGWAIMGFFALTFFCLHMIETNPALLANPGFMQFISALSTGGILLVASNLFGGTKASSEANAKMAEALTSAAPAQPVVTVSPPATVTVEGAAT